MTATNGSTAMKWVQIGDVCVNVALVASHHGVSLDAIAAANVAKLRARYPHGFTQRDSINRVEG